MIDGNSFFDMLLKNEEETYEQIEMRRNNDYSTGNLLDPEYFLNHYRLIATDLSNQNELENPDVTKCLVLFIDLLR